jgi:antitoxin component of RelBE/YafQ-DinJ toxin-antitoxin module
MKQNLTTVVEHTVKAQLEKLGLEQGMTLSKFVRFILEQYLEDQKHPNRLAEVGQEIEQSKQELKQKILKDWSDDA